MRGSYVREQLRLLAAAVVRSWPDRQDSSWRIYKVESPDGRVAYVMCREDDKKSFFEITTERLLS